MQRKELIGARPASAASSSARSHATTGDDAAADKAPAPEVDDRLRRDVDGALFLLRRYRALRWQHALAAARVTLASRRPQLS